jgi:hypothetical protein
MATHYFHCTDGADLIADRDGREITGCWDLARSARDAADTVMRAVPSYGAWEAWAVHVYDAQGQVAIVPFLPSPAEAAIFSRDMDEPEPASLGPIRCPEPKAVCARL